MNLTAIEAKPFVPTNDFDRAKTYYAALDLEIPWSAENLAYVRHGHNLSCFKRTIGQSSFRISRCTFSSKVLTIRIRT